MLNPTVPYHDTAFCDTHNQHQIAYCERINCSSSGLASCFFSHHQTHEEKGHWSLYVSSLDVWRVWYSDCLSRFDSWLLWYCWLGEAFGL